LVVEGETVDGLVVLYVLSGVVLGETCELVVVVVVDEFGLNVESGLVVVRLSVSGEVVVWSVLGDVVVVWSSGVVELGLVWSAGAVELGVVDCSVELFMLFMSVLFDGVVLCVVVDGDVEFCWSGLGVCASARPVTVITENSAAAANPFDFMLPPNPLPKNVRSRALRARLSRPSRWQSRCHGRSAGSGVSD
jgi:hypothetical protein